MWRGGGGRLRLGRFFLGDGRELLRRRRSHTRRHVGTERTQPATARNSLPCCRRGAPRSEAYMLSKYSACNEAKIAFASSDTSPQIVRLVTTRSSSSLIRNSR